MRDDFDDSVSDFKYAFAEKFTLFFSIGFLIINLLIFALVMSVAWKMSLILAAVFTVYIPIGYFDKQEQIWEITSRVLEILTSLSLSLAYILLFGKFWLLFLPVIEVAAAILFYIFVYRSVFSGDDDDDEPISYRRLR